jgi:dTMP kinase
MSDSLFSERSNRPGMLVTIDGPNGSGKTYLAEAVTAELDRLGVSVYRTRQPSPSPLGDLVRDSEAGISGRSLACLVAADRHRQVEGEIAKHLGAGKVVICDRYVESSLVLQRLDRVETDFIIAINTGIPRPDFRIRLEAEPDEIRARLASREPDRRRRFERSAGPERELELYEEADRLLAESFGVAGYVYDTTHTDAEQLGLRVAQTIKETFGDGR